MIFVSSGLGTNSHTWFIVNCPNSSCIVLI
jgi:hypothetical protein